MEATGVVTTQPRTEELEREFFRLLEMDRTSTEFLSLFRQVDQRIGELARSDRNRS